MPFLFLFFASWHRVVKHQHRSLLFFGFPSLVSFFRKALTCYVCIFQKHHRSLYARIFLYCNFLCGHKLSVNLLVAQFCVHSLECIRIGGLFSRHPFKFLFKSITRVLQTILSMVKFIHLCCVQVLDHVFVKFELFLYQFIFVLRLFIRLYCCSRHLIHTVDLVLKQS